MPIEPKFSPKRLPVAVKASMASRWNGRPEFRKRTLLHHKCGCKNLEPCFLSIKGTVCSLGRSI